MLFKRCERCGGDIFLEREIGETDLVCLQCGYRRTLDATQLRQSKRVQPLRRPIPIPSAA